MNLTYAELPVLIVMKKCLKLKLRTRLVLLNGRCRNFLNFVLITVAHSLGLLN